MMVKWTLDQRVEDIDNDSDDGGVQKRTLQTEDQDRVEDIHKWKHQQQEKKKLIRHCTNAWMMIQSDDSDLLGIVVFARWEAMWVEQGEQVEQVEQVSAWSEAGVTLSAAQHSWRGSESVEGKLFLEIFWQIIGWLKLKIVSAWLV